MKKHPNFMQPLDIYKQVPTEYILIDYNNGPTRQKIEKSVHLTEYEAHNLNQSFALNGVTKRYIKAT